MTLFEVPDKPPVTRASTLDRGAGGKPRWNRYRPKTRVACDECVMVLHENKGVGAYPQAARWSRVSVAGRFRLCLDHAALWRKDDGLT